MCDPDIPIIGDIVEIFTGGGGSSGMRHEDNPYSKPIVQPIIQPPIVQPIIDSNPISQIEQAAEGAGPVLGEIIEEPFEQGLDITGGLIGGTLGASAGVLGTALDQGFGDLGNFFDAVKNKKVKSRYPRSNPNFWEDPISKKYLNYQAQNTLLTSGQGANRQGQASRPSTTGSRNILGL